MTTINKKEIMKKKEEYLNLMSEYFDAMIDYDFCSGAEIQEKICKLLPIDLLIDYNTDVINWIKTGRRKDFYKTIIETYNNMTDEEKTKFEGL